ncbi:MAG: HAD-IC family P-type ATPase [Lachnospiraceae bacterium]|nr:HAD-IC family P-type ATPase [Lachnospiraceae bacterium]
MSESYFKTGLTSAQVQERMARGLVNGDTEVKTKSIRRIIAEHAVTLFNIINLLLALAVALVGSFKNMLFMGIVISNTLIGVIQEVRSKRMVDQLSIMVASAVEALRDGKLIQLRVEDIVQDDLLHIRRGSQIPVDAVLIWGTLSANESLVTGESDLISKNPGDEVISGSFAASGDAWIRVTRVGKECFAAGISRDAKTVKKAESEIMRTLSGIVRIISFIIVPVGALLFYNQYAVVGSDLKDAVVSTAAALVTMIPEGLMLLTSSVMAVAVIRLSRKNVLVQQMYCIETLARVDVLCLDKTGTITSGKMQVVGLLPFEGATIAEAEEGFRRLAAVSRDEGATPDAIRACFGKDASIQALRVVDFSSEKKYSGAEFPDGTYVMGAGEMIFGDGYRKLEDQIREKIGANRVIVMTRSLSGFDSEGNAPSDVRPLGALLIRDEIRPQAADTIRFFTEQGVDLKVISGDGVETVSNIAAAAGIPGYDRYVDARTLRTEEDIARAMATKSVFGRVTPAQKRAFVRALQKQGHTVAMTGDGVNDVLAMKESDCSVAMASGSEAARNVAQLVLTTDDFSSMPQVVAEGRRSINNIQRSSSLFLTKTLFSIFNSILFTFAVMPYPFEPIQLTYISFLTIGFPSFVLALQPNKERVRGNFFLNIVTRALAGGGTMFVGLLLSYLAGVLFGLEFEEISMICVLATGITMFCLLIRISLPFDWIRGTLVGVVAAGLVAGGILLKDLLGFVALDWKLGLILTGIACINAVLFFCSFHLCEKMRDTINARYPDELLKENRRRKLEKKALRAERRLRHSEERRKAWNSESGLYKTLVMLIASPISRIRIWLDSLKKK